MLIFSLHS